MATRTKPTTTPSEPLCERPEVTCYPVEVLDGLYHVEPAVPYAGSVQRALDEPAERIHDWSWWKNAA